MRSKVERRVPTRQVLLLLACAVMLAGGGCTRAFWRNSADWEVYALIDESSAKGNAPLLDEFTIQVDPASRMFDPFSPDCPPMPPDDPDSHRLMHCVDGKCGFPCWHRNGDVPLVDDRHWLAYLPLDQDGNLVLDMRGAVEVALLHSRDFQSQLETLYLSALDVTFERFRFDTQFFGGYATSYEARGRAAPGGTASILNLRSSPSTNFRAQRLLASGGQVVTEFANSFVWQFAGPNSYSANSLLDFSLVQPLLRAGTRAVVLERLTVSERTLLANLRQMERYRRGYYLEVSIGRNAGPGPRRRGGLFGGAGLEGFSGVGVGGFGQVGGVAGVGGGTGAAGARGFLGLVQDGKEIENQEANVAGLRDSLAQLEALYDAGRIDRFQVDLARQALYNAQSRLLTSRAGYESTLDAFKITLGLPPHLNVTIRDPILDRFELLDPRLTQIQVRVADLLDAVRDPARRGDQSAWNEALGQSRSLRQAGAGHVAVVEADFNTLNENLADRRESLRELATLLRSNAAALDQSAYSTEGLAERVDTMRDEFARLIERFERTADLLDEFLAAPPSAADDRARDRLIELLTDVSGQLSELALIQARVRLDSIRLVKVDMTPEEAFRIAEANRRDLANARAQLVDAWRLIEFNANDLMSDLTLTLSGDLSTTEDNPFRFRDTTGRLRVGVEFDAPLTRIAERNQYRQALIEYQQARRSFMQLEDQIEQGLRNTLRTVDLNRLNLELRRAAVLVAINQVDLTRLRLEQPPRPGETTQLGATTARDLVDALGGLLQAQNDFISVWVNYEVQRMNLDFDLGTMQLDHHGLWIDPGPIVGSDERDGGRRHRGRDRSDSPPVPFDAWQLGDPYETAPIDPSAGFDWSFDLPQDISSYEIQEPPPVYPVRLGDSRAITRRATDEHGAPGRANPTGESSKGARAAAGRPSGGATGDWQSAPRAGGSGWQASN